MPQMMPINWIFLFMYFTIIYFMFMILNFYLFNNNTNNKSNKINIKLNNLLWKW